MGDEEYEEEALQILQIFQNYKMAYQNLGKPSSLFENHYSVSLPNSPLAILIMFYVWRLFYLLDVFHLLKRGYMIHVWLGIG